jgi:hypothetical protein
MLEYTTIAVDLMSSRVGQGKPGIHITRVAAYPTPHPLEPHPKSLAQNFLPVSQLSLYHTLPHPFSSIPCWIFLLNAAATEVLSRSEYQHVISDC